MIFYLKVPKLKPQSAEAVIAELRRSLNDVLHRKN
jgi:hypothetical protein